MSKSRIMGAASSGYNYGANKNSPGNGNGKWQGLWPSVGHARNARYINTRAGGDNRNVVFCMNQLGGVGRISNMFATTADGVKQPCPGSKTFFGAAALEAVLVLEKYLKAKYGHAGGLILVGRKETLTSDNVNNPQLFESIKHFYPGTQEYNDLPLREQQAADVINNLGISVPLKKGGPAVPHVAGYETVAGQIALRQKGFGAPLQFGPQTVVYAYGACDVLSGIFGALTRGASDFIVDAIVANLCTNQYPDGGQDWWNCYDYNIKCAPNS